MAMLFIVIVVITFREIIQFQKATGEIFILENIQNFRKKKLKKKTKCMGIWYNMCKPNPDFQKLTILC